MKKMLLVIFLSCSALFARLDPTEETSNFIVQTKIGEEAINRILRAYIKNTYSLEVPNCGKLNLIINDVGLDIQGEVDVNAIERSSNIVFHLSYVIQAQTSDGACQEFVKKINVPQQVEYPKAVTITMKTLAEGVVAMVDLDGVLEELLKQYNYPAPLKNKFSEILQKRTLFEQKYGELIQQTKNAIENVDVQVVVLNTNFAVGKVADHVTIDFILKTQSKSQDFDIDNGVLVSNKKFRILKVIYLQSGPYFYYKNSCSTVKTVNFSTEHRLCEEGSSPKGQVLLYLQTEHGGVISKVLDLD